MNFPTLLAAGLIVVTLLMGLRLVMRQNRAADLEVGNTITPEDAAPSGAWISVAVLVALSIAASWWAWGQPNRPARPASTAEAPKADAPQAKSPSRNWFQDLLDELRPRPSRPREPKPDESGVAPAPEPADEGKPREDLAPGAAPTANAPVPPAPIAEPPRAAPTTPIADPRWIRRPTPAQLARLRPDGAKNTVGAAVLNCTVGPAGRLRDCRVLVENPRGAGFGDAALRASIYWRMAPETRSGQPTEGRSVRVPMAFVP